VLHSAAALAFRFRLPSSKASAKRSSPFPLRVPVPRRAPKHPPDTQPSFLLSPQRQSNPRRLPRLATTFHKTQIRPASSQSSAPALDESLALAQSPHARENISALP